MRDPVQSQATVTTEYVRIESKRGGLLLLFSQFPCSQQCQNFWNDGRHLNLLLHCMVFFFFLSYAVTSTRRSEAWVGPGHHQRLHPHLIQTDRAALVSLNGCPAIFHRARRSVYLVQLARRPPMKSLILSSFSKKFGCAKPIIWVFWSVTRYTERTSSFWKSLCITQKSVWLIFREAFCRLLYSCAILLMFS